MCLAKYSITMNEIVLTQHFAHACMHTHTHTHTHTLVYCQHCGQHHTHTHAPPHTHAQIHTTLPSIFVHTYILESNQHFCHLTSQASREVKNLNSSYTSTVVTFTESAHTKCTFHAQTVPVYVVACRYLSILFDLVRTYVCARPLVHQ